jgi:hypothetical protein
MFSIKGIEIVNYQDKLYRVYRRINKNRIKEGCINDVKEMWHCDIVLKNKNQEDETLMFLIEIPDAIIVDSASPSPTPASTVKD